MDHEPLAAAVDSGELFVLLYCFEPSLLQSPKHAPRHWRFVAESLADLRVRGWPVISWWGEVDTALEALHEAVTIGQIMSHQETGHLLSFQRDRRVRAWCAKRGIEWREYVQDGVIRGRKHRRGFAEHVDAFLAGPLRGDDYPRDRVWSAADVGLPPAEASAEWTEDFTRAQTTAATEPARSGVFVPTLRRRHPLRQPGGEQLAWRYLKSFTSERGGGYARQIGSPSLSRRSCSRLSTYLAWGCISVRRVFQWARSARVRPAFREDLKFFRERLWWRAHYYQKLEADYRIEFRAINPALDQLGRRRDEEVFALFRKGRTGFPMVDAAVRCLEATGWINFRLRAMLVTFTTFVLWLDWRMVATWLGSRFLDYDPGIHYGQLQMQAGLTGYHPPRNYNPYLQGEKFDREGDFVHEWVPELAGVPAPWCHYPHRLTALERELYGLQPEDYPAPLVDFASKAKDNMDRYWAIRNGEAAQAALPAIWELHCLPENIAQYERGEVPDPRRDV